MKIELENYLVNEHLYSYPKAFKKIIELNLIDFDLWYIVDKVHATRRYYDLKTRYPSRKLIPFAKRCDNDDIACFEVGENEKVQLIHDFASEGFEQRGEFDDVWDWLCFAVNEMVKYNREDE